MSNAYGIFPKWFKQPVCLLNIFVEVSFENSDGSIPTLFSLHFLQSLSQTYRSLQPTIWRVGRLKELWKFQQYPTMLQQFLDFFIIQSNK